MNRDLPPPELGKPLAGTCHHRWENQKSPYAVAQLCKICKLFRYKTNATADWEFRAPIPIGRIPSE
jgi:hypothetical protein